MNDSERWYMSKSVLETLGISRSSLLYYERIGLIEKRTEAGSSYRRYSDTDIYKLFAYVSLRNIGYPANTATERIRHGEDLLDMFHLDEYRREIDERMQFDTALKESLSSIAAIRARFDRDDFCIIEGPIPSFDFYPDSAEHGYDEALFSDTHDLLVGLVPISSFGVTYEGDFLKRRVKRHWARTIPTRYRFLMGDRHGPAFSLGGCPGFSVPCILEPEEGRDFPFADDHVMNSVANHLALNDLRLTSQPFLAGALPNTTESFFGVMYFPAR